MFERRIWDTTLKRFVPLITISLNELWDKQQQQQQQLNKSSLSSVVTSVELCAESRTLALANSRGELFVFAFTLKDKSNHQVIVSLIYTILIDTVIPSPNFNG